jgi:hypothetical protein
MTLHVSDGLSVHHRELKTVHTAVGCSRTFFIYLFLRFAGVSYERFIAVRFGFNLSTYIQNCWGWEGGERFKRRNDWEQLTDGSNPVRSQSRTRGVSEGVQVTVILIKYDLVV